MYYFRFEIPTMLDGSRVSYSPNWHGTMPKCPKDVTVLLYHDKEGYGIARTEDSFVPPEVEPLTKEQVIETAKRLAEEGGLTVGYYGMPVILDAAKWAVELDDTGSFVFTHPDVGTKPATLTFSEGIYAGQKLKDRWLPEAVGEGEVSPENKEPDTTGVVTEKQIIDSFLKFCPSCHQIVARIVRFEDGTCEVWQAGKCIIRGIKTANLVLTCPALHKVKVVL